MGNIAESFLHENGTRMPHAHWVAHELLSFWETGQEVTSKPSPFILLPTTNQGLLSAADREPGIKYIRQFIWRENPPNNFQSAIAGCANKPSEFSDWWAKCSHKDSDLSPFERGKTRKSVWPRMIMTSSYHTTTMTASPSDTHWTCGNGTITSSFSPDSTSQAFTGALTSRELACSEGQASLPPMQLAHLYISHSELICWRTAQQVKFKCWRQIAQMSEIAGNPQWGSMLGLKASEQMWMLWEAG